MRIKLKYLAILFLLSCFCLQAEEAKLTLETAVRAALTYNERAAAAEERLNVSKAQLLKARSFFLPSLTASATYTRRPFEVERTINDQTIVIQSMNALAGNLNLNMTLFDSRSIPLLRKLKMQNKAEKYVSLETKRALSFEVANTFIVTLGIEQVLKAARQRYDLAGKNLAASRARYEAQLVSVNDVTRTELEAASAEKNLIQAGGDVENSRLLLGFLLGSEIKGELADPGEILSQAEAPAGPAERSIADAAALRPDLAALRWYARAQHAAVVEPILRWLPSLSLNGQYRFTNESGLTGRKTNWSVGLTFNWSLFDGFTRIGDYKELKSLSRIANLDLQTASRKVVLEVRNALVTLANQQVSLKQAALALEVARKNAVETAELYRQGLTGALQAADANVRLYEAEVEFIRVRYGLAIAFLNLRSALGLDPFGKQQTTAASFYVSESSRESNS